MDEMTKQPVELFQVTLADGYELPPIHPLAAYMDLSIDPDPILRQIAAPINPETLPNEDLNTLVAKMIFTMYSNGGIGLAAPQVGHPARVIVLDHRWGADGKLEPSALVNPEITDTWDEATIHEGCLSVGSHFYTDIKRAYGVEVTGLDLQGNPVNFVAEGLLAAVIQHEVDHLNGVLFIDKIGKARKMLLEGKKRKLKRKAKRIANNMKG